MILVATDLDRTLLPNGPFPERSGAIQDLFKQLSNLDYQLVYVTGRNLDLTLEAEAEFGIPRPDYLIAEVGTRIYQKHNQELLSYEPWHNHINQTNPSWNRQDIEAILTKYDLHLQEGWKQNPYKVSYYCQPEKTMPLAGQVRSVLNSRQISAQVIDSYDPLLNEGLIDVLPDGVNKLSALEFLRHELALNKSEVIYCGDSGNDTLPLTAGYKAIAVKNTPEEVKSHIKKLVQEKGYPDNLYIATGQDPHGNYADGIIQGLKHYDII